ncbi:hypothetical protein [Ruegeria hyattellae]|uniref:hypothetical protein n=1 Tax=Ruegeria hyattellae TaxID=3233337 RepID=UPI00355B1B10
MTATQKISAHWHCKLARPTLQNAWRTGLHCFRVAGLPGLVMNLRGPNPMP